MKRKTLFVFFVMIVMSMIVSACSTPTPVIIEKTVPVVQTQIVKETVVVTQEVEVVPTQPAPVEAQAGKLVSAPVTEAPIVDGNLIDSAWAMAPETVLDIQAMGIPAYKMTVKSVYTSDMVYFLFQYPDSNYDVVRHAWAFNTETKAWENLSDDFGDEDEFGLWWNMTMPDYAAKGCFQACHGEKMLAPAGTNADDWRWNSIRSSVMGWTRDFIMTDNPDADPSGGFTKDEGFDVNRGYVNNEQEVDGILIPAYWKPFSGTGGVATGDPRYLLQSEIDAGVAKKITSFDKATGVLTDETGAVVPSWVWIPGYILSAPSGPSWNDIAAKGAWTNGMWTVEFARKLVTGHADDIQFNDLTSTYFFDGYIKTRQSGAGGPHDNIPTTPFIFAVE